MKADREYFRDSRLGLRRFSVFIIKDKPMFIIQPVKKHRLRELSRANNPELGQAGWKKKKTKHREQE